MVSASDAHDAGVQELQQGRAESALPLLEKAVLLRPHNAQYHHDLGSALAMLDRHEDALASLAEAVRLAPDDAWSHADAGMSLLAIGQNEDGMNELYAAVQLAPNDARLLINFGIALARFGAHEQAEEALRRATERASDHPLGWTLLADTLWVQGKYDESLPAAQRAAELAPNDAAAQMALGNALQMTAHFEEAAAAFRRVIVLEPDLADAHHNLALTLRKSGRVAESLQLYEQILSRWPDATEARVDRALVMLTLGKLEEGFAEYELRATLPYFASRADPARIKWEGSDPNGLAIVIHNDQGLGDLIQYIRYATLLAERGASISVACPPDLEPVIASVQGVREVVDPTVPPLPGEVWAWASSLPALFKTTLSTIPADVPYIHADPQRVARWRERLGDDGNFKVGMVWAGGAVNDNDRARSCRLSDLAPLASDQITFYSLQKGPPALQAAKAPAGMNLIDLGEQLNDFGETAAAMACLDLIISVDTAAAHLAGAMGRPVWTLLYKGADWRYLLDREDSPWYPTMRLFRQTELGNWQHPIARIAEQLLLQIKNR